MNTYPRTSVIQQYSVVVCQSLESLNPWSADAPVRLSLGVARRRVAGNRQGLTDHWGLYGRLDYSGEWF